MTIGSSEEPDPGTTGDPESVAGSPGGVDIAAKAAVVDPRPRRVGRIAAVGAVLLGIVALSVAVVIALGNAASANRWKQQATRTADQLAALQNERDDLADRLREADETISELEERTIMLADEKARALDRATIADVDGATAAAVADQLEQCTTDLVTMFTAIAEARSQDELDRLTGQLQATAGLCESAAGAARGLSGYLSSEHHE